jgi:proteasome activator subunit 4
MDGSFDMSQSLDPSSASYLHVLNSFVMDEEDISTTTDSPTIETPDLSREQATIVKQRASLQTYLSSLPYNAESEEDMQARLEFILSRIIICAEAKNWLVLATWDGVLQWCALEAQHISCTDDCSWLLMRYPVPVRIRAKLARLYYELCILPGIEPRLIRSWADMFSRLLAGKSDSRRKLEPEDLQVPWKPLWRVLQREIWPRTRFQDPS